MKRWQEMFGISAIDPGIPAPGRQVVFDGQLKNVAPQIILADFIVDHIYPVIPQSDCEIAARCGKHIIGVHRKVDSGGALTYLGYRPRDDQSASLGYETRNWFEALHALGAYPGSDNTEVISRTTDYLACRFPNGTTAIAPHLTKLEEAWPGGFARNREEDQTLVEYLEIPSRQIKLKSFQVNGHCIDYEGSGAVAFRMDSDGNLMAFAGHDCSDITINGKHFDFADHPVGQIGWAPVPESRQVENGAKLIVVCSSAASIRIPAAPYSDIKAFYAEGQMLGQKGESVSCKRAGEYLIIEIPQVATSRQIFGV